MSTSDNLTSQEDIKKDEILSAIAEGSSDGIMRIDANGNIGSWTAGAERMLGYRPEEIVGESGDVIVPEELRQEVRKNIQTQMNEGFVFHVETVRLHKNGKRIPVLLTRMPLKNAEGETFGLLSVLKDISEQKKLRKQVEVLQRNNAMAKVAAKVAHEIRTPLGVLFLKSDLLMERLDMAFENWGKGDIEKHRKLLEKSQADIQKQIARLEEIANNYLHLSKTRSMEREEVHLKSFVKELSREIKEQFQQQTIALDFSMTDNVKTAYFDLQQFQRVIINLFRNSAEALNASNIKNGQIELTVERHDDWLTFVVRDNGPGMSDEIKESVFDPFTTTKSIGTGLGLYLVREIVENHGGTITIDAVPNGGTAVQISIPLKGKENRDA